LLGQFSEAASPVERGCLMDAFQARAFQAFTYVIGGQFGGPTA
jgi:hypothetical protein